MSDFAENELATISCPSVPTKLTASFFTLGCRLNQADTSLMSENLRRTGYRLVPWGEPADLLVVNSCTVTAAASRKTRQAVRAARRRCPAAFIVLAGCSANVECAKWESEAAVDLILPNPVKTRLSNFLPSPLRRSTHPVAVAANLPPKGETFIEQECGFHYEKTRANVKIQEGCDFFCSYCIVPYARGHARSRAWENVIREAEILVTRGYRELVLTGVNIATYNDQGRDLADLLLRLLEIPGDFRIRLSSTEPGPILSRVVDVMRDNPRVCRFLHLPLQYGEDTLLKAMRRRYTVAQFADFANHALATIPGLCLGTDLIVGFPGETDPIFETCCQTVRSLPFAYMHVFTYSRRTGTTAASFPNQVHGTTALHRHQLISKIAAQKALGFARCNVGETLLVLTETRNSAGHLEGWSDNYLRVEILDPSDTIDTNQIAPVRIAAVMNGRLVRGTC